MTNLTAVDIARLEEARQAAAVAAMMRFGAERIDSERYAVLEIAGGVACYAGPGAWANQAMGLGMDGEVTAEELQQLESFFESRHAEPRIELCAHAAPDFVEALGERRWQLKEFENVLALDLADAGDIEAQRRELPEGYVLERVDLKDEAAVDELGVAAMSGFLIGRESLSEVWAESNRLSALVPGSAGWVVRDPSGRAVSGSSMEVSTTGAASLFGTSVLPDHRRQGIQTRLIVERLLHARENGARVVTIHSSPHVATGRNAARLGFRLAYAKAILVRPGEGLAPAP